MSSAEFVSHLLTFIGGVAVGAFGKYFADHGTDRRRKREARNQTLTQFRRLQHAMPALIEQMKQDLAESPDVRDFAVLSGGMAFNYPQDHFRYLEEQYSDLRGKLVLLEQSGHIHRIVGINVPVYRMTQEFVDLVLKE